MNQKLLTGSSANEEIVWVVAGNLGDLSRGQHWDSVRKSFNSEHGLKRYPLIKFVDDTMLRGVVNTKMNWKIICEKPDELKTGAVHWRLVTHNASFVYWRTNSNLCYKLDR